MVQLVIELPDDLYERLCMEAHRVGKSPEQLAIDILTDYLSRREEFAGSEEVERHQLVSE